MVRLFPISPSRGEGKEKTTRVAHAAHRGARGTLLPWMYEEERKKRPHAPDHPDKRNEKTRAGKEGRRGIRMSASILSRSEFPPSNRGRARRPVIKEEKARGAEKKTPAPAVGGKILRKKLGRDAAQGKKKWQATSGPARPAPAEGSKDRPRILSSGGRGKLSVGHLPSSTMRCARRKKG